MSFPEILSSVKQTAEAFEAFRDAQGKRIGTLQDEQSALRERIEELEAKGMSPGKTGAMIKVLTDSWVTPDGEARPILRKGMDFSSFYPQPGDASLSDFVRGVAGMKVTSEINKKALSVGTDSSGGYAVPTELLPGILAALVPASSLMQANAGIIDVSGTEAKTFNVAALNAIPTAAWRNEAGSVAESDPTFRLVQATPRSLAFFFKVSRELLADALNLEPALRTAIAQAFARELDRVGLRGTGSAPEPRGLLNTSGIQSVTNGANGASLATTAYANFISAAQSLLAADAGMPNAAIMSPRSLTVLGGLLDTTNQPRQRPPMLDQVQFITTSQIPNNLTVGTSTDCTEIYTGNFTRMFFVMRETPTIMVAKEVFASTGQLGFFCHVRADVVVQYPASFAVVTGVRP